MAEEGVYFTNIFSTLFQGDAGWGGGEILESRYLEIHLCTKDFILGGSNPPPSPLKKMLCPTQLPPKKFAPPPLRLQKRVRNNGKGK